MGSLVETAATRQNGFNPGSMICGVAARRRAHVLGVERVLEREHDAVHWHLVERGVAAVLRIEFGGAFERIGIVAKHLADRRCAGGQWAQSDRCRLTDRKVAEGVGNGEPCFPRAQRSSTIAGATRSAWMNSSGSL